MNFVLNVDFDPGDAVSPKFIFVFNYLTAPPPRQLQATRNSSDTCFGDFLGDLQKYVIFSQSDILCFCLFLKT